jgi:NAD(P)-dependent dehydrogenase (short-subunit alcohol dehydrogenase family)
MRSLQSLMNLTGRVALVTGGAGHLGGAMSEALAEQGAALVVLDLEDEACSKAADDLHAAYGIDTLPLAVDLADEAAVRDVPSRVVERFGRLDILINNAALVGTSALKGWATPFPEQSADTWRLALEVNLTAPFVLTQAAAPSLAASGHGSVVNIGSIYGLVGPDPGLYAGTPLGNPAAYAASKGGLLQFTRWLATVMAPLVRVNAITVGGVWRQQSETFHERYLARTPLKRMAIEEDLKGAAAYLASDLSAYVTGTNVVVDGGWTAW